MVWQKCYWVPTLPLQMQTIIIVDYSKLWKLLQQKMNIGNIRKKWGSAAAILLVNLSMLFALFVLIFWLLPLNWANTQSIWPTSIIKLFTTFSIIFAIPLVTEFIIGMNILLQLYQMGHYPNICKKICFWSLSSESWSSSPCICWLWLSWQHYSSKVGSWYGHYICSR